ncbi:MAG: hypothetical protein LBL55_09510 [Propionibacteriaceae bacterium]|nr:hypothetical protein [Propionibacteriaceae bacterium]
MPERHYMVDISGRVETIIRDYIGPGGYFTISRPRQYGKTTLLEAIRRELLHTDVIVDLSFEAVYDSLDTVEKFVPTFCSMTADAVRQSGGQGAAGAAGRLEAGFAGGPSFRGLGERISALCESLPGRVVLLIDEVDKATDYQVFAGFLGLLRDQFLERNNKGTPTFHSVILAGVHDVKNLKQKIRPDSEHSYNSPWNIAVPFEVDLSFGPADIATLLADYEADHRTRMDVAAVAQELSDYTSGYPFLVSRLCEIVDRRGLSWDAAGVERAVVELTNEQNTLFDDLVKNMEANDALRDVVWRIIMDAETIPFDRSAPTIDFGALCGALRRGASGSSAIGNRIFETKLASYLIARAATTPAVQRSVGTPANYIHGGKLDLGELLSGFKAFMRSEYRQADGRFIERHARLLLLAYIRPVVNGAGFYYIEPETGDARRMDLVVQYGGEEHIVELKIWHGSKRDEAALDQLTAYLEARGADHGHLVSFTDQQRQPREDATFVHRGRAITETVIAYRDAA